MWIVCNQLKISVYSEKPNGSRIVGKNKRETQLLNRMRISLGKNQSVTLRLCNLVFLAQRHLRWAVRSAPLAPSLAISSHYSHIPALSVNTKQWSKTAPSLNTWPLISLMALMTHCLSKLGNAGKLSMARKVWGPQWLLFSAGISQATSTSRERNSILQH